MVRRDAFHMRGFPCGIFSLAIGAGKVQSIAPENEIGWYAMASMDAINTRASNGGGTVVAVGCVCFQTSRLGARACEASTVDASAFDNQQVGLSASSFPSVSFLSIYV